MTTTHLNFIFRNILPLFKWKNKSVEISKFLFIHRRQHFHVVFLGPLFFDTFPILYTTRGKMLYHFFIFMIIVSLLHFSLFEFGVWKIMYSILPNLSSRPHCQNFSSIQTNRFFIRYTIFLWKTAKKMLFVAYFLWLIYLKHLWYFNVDISFYFENKLASLLVYIL